MNVQLNTRSEAILKEEMASGRFRSPEEVIERALESFHDIGHAPVPQGRPRSSLEQFRHFLNALAEGCEKIPALPTSAFSRESIYQDHP